MIKNHDQENVNSRRQNKERQSCAKANRKTFKNMIIRTMDQPKEEVNVCNYSIFNLYSLQRDRLRSTKNQQ